MMLKFQLNSIPGPLSYDFRLVLQSQISFYLILDLNITWNKTTGDI